MEGLKAPRLSAGSSSIQASRQQAVASDGCGLRAGTDDATQQSCGIQAATDSNRPDAHLEAVNLIYPKAVIKGFDGITAGAPASSPGPAR